MSRKTIEEEVVDPHNHCTSRRRMAVLVTVFCVALTLGACTTLSQLQALRHVDFFLDRVSDVRLAGVRLDEVEAWSDLSIDDAASIVSAAMNRELPLEMVVHVQAENPPENKVTARLVDLDWKLYLEDRETVDGRLAGTYLLPPGEPVDVPVGVRLEMVRFFGTNARDLLELALALRGRGTKEVRLEAVPKIQTALGPLRYPTPITIRKRVGRTP